MSKKRFIIKQKQHISGGIIKIFVDLETGVNYLSSSGMGINGMTPLLDEKGNVIVDKIMQRNVNKKQT